MNTLDTFLKSAYAKWRDNDYLHQSGRTETYGSFTEKVNYFAACLREKGFAGKNIGIFSPNSIEWMIADIAIMNYVGVSVGLSKDWKYDDLLYALKKCDIACLLYSEVNAEMIGAAKSVFPEVAFICVEKEFESCVAEGKVLCAELFTLPTKTDGEAAKIVMTSGSTSFPKAVLLSIKNIFSGWESLQRRIHVTEEDICYLFLPLSHTYGSIYNFIYSLVFGFRIYLAENIKTMAQEMGAIRPTLFSAVPIVFIKFLEGAKQYGIPVKMLLGGRIKYLFCGGADLTLELRNSYIQQGLYLMNAYALSETASAFSLDYPGDSVLDSVGTLFENLDAKVIAPGEDGYGELAVKGDNVFIGYYNDEEATRAVFDSEGYFRTGDIGCIKDKHVYVRGRKDTMIVLPNGENVSSNALVQKIKQTEPSIRSVKLYVRDNALTADIYSSAQLDWDSLIEALNNTLPKYERIRKYNIVDPSLLLK
ncbi:MAG: AMP-binding protein [Clostridia bacterium]|nr:AMP-binding protein [Clostridia bacterium]